MVENRLQNPQTEKVEPFSAGLVEPFQRHPFRVASGEERGQLKESIREYGVLSTLLVRPREDGRYEIVSGLRRKADSRCPVSELSIYLKLLWSDISTKFLCCTVHWQKKRWGDGAYR